MRQEDWLESFVMNQRFIWANLIETFSVRMPFPVSKLEKRCRVSRLGIGIGIIVERLFVENDANQGEQASRPPISGPNDLVMPVAFIPSKFFDGISPTKRREESGFQPLALKTKLVASAIDAEIFENFAQGTLDHKPGGKDANRDKARPEHRRHRKSPSVPSDNFPILESYA